MKDDEPSQIGSSPVTAMFAEGGGLIVITIWSSASGHDPSACAYIVTTTVPPLIMDSGTL